MASKSPQKDSMEIKLKESEQEFYDNFQELTGYKRSIFMIGITGAGKSAFCNFLANQKLFHEGCGFISKTQTAGACKFNFNSEDVLIIDCPGFCDSKRPAEDIQDEICKVGVMAKDGTDAVAIVVNSMERFSDNHRNVLNQLEYLGGSLWEHAFLVFTRESEIIDELSVKSGEEYIEMISTSMECPPVLTEWLKKTQRRFVCVDSKKKFQNEPYRNEKCTKIFRMIDDIRIKTKNVRYNNSLMAQGAKFFRQVTIARKSEEGMQKLTIQMEQQRREDTKKIEEAQIKLEDAQKAGMEKNEEDRKRYEEAQNEIREIHRRNEEKMRQYEVQQQKLREEHIKAKNEKDKEIQELKSKLSKYLSSSCFSGETKVTLATGELANICDVKKGHMVATPNGPRKVALLSKIKRYQDTLYSINNLDFKFNKYHPFVAWNAPSKEGTSFAVIDVNDFINFMPTMAARNVKSLYDKATKLTGYSNEGQSPVSIHSISNSCEELPTEYDILYDVILEPNGTGFNEYYAGDGNQMFLVSSEISSYTLEAEQLYIPAHIAILSIINETSQRESVYASSSLNTENDVINFFENEIVQNGIGLLYNAMQSMSHFQSLKLTKASKSIYEMEKRLKQTLSFFSGPKPIAVTTLSLIYEYLHTLICPLHTMIKLGWRTYMYVTPEERDMLAIGISDVSIVSDKCYADPIEILLMANTEQEPYKLGEKGELGNPRMRQITESIYIPFNEMPDDKLYLIVKEKNTPKVIARKCIKLESGLQYDYRLLRLFSYDNVNISEVRVNMDLRVVSSGQMKQENEAKQDWKEEFEIHFAEIFASKIVDSLVEKVKP